mgnify:FL=1
MSKKPTRREKREGREAKHADAIDRALRKIDPPRDEPSEYEPTDEELQ